VAALGARLAAWQPDSGATLAHGFYNSAVDPERAVVADSLTWAAVWAQVTSPTSALPAVDFTTYRVLVAALGERSSGGYDIRIDSIAQFERGNVAYVTTIAPGSTCGTTQALTQPLHILRVPADLAQDLVWDNRAVVRDCS